MKLFVIATPIGNLSDMSERAKTVLASVDTVLCEDTRVTKRLLDSYNIKTRVLSYHQHSSGMKLKQVIDLLAEKNDLALVTDAGTPGISDPGGQLVEALVTHFGNELVVIPIPGPSAVTTALSISGMQADKFVFLGFPPNKKARAKFFDGLGDYGLTVVFYESTHRIFKALEEIKQRFPNRHLVVCRELTKLHESIYRGTALEVTEQLKSTSMKGEFVIVIANK